MITYISLTYRPLPEYLPTIEEFASIFSSNPSVLQYYIAGEKAMGEKVNHYQCWIAGQSRQDHFRSYVVRKLMAREKKDPNFEVSLKLKTIKQGDVSYVLGYCQKERIEHVTNIPLPKLQEAEREYNDHEVVVNVPITYSSLSLDEIYRIIVSNHREKGLTHFDEKLFRRIMKTHGDHVHFSVKQRIHLEKLEYYVNIDLE